MIGLNLYRESSHQDTAANSHQDTAAYSHQDTAAHSHQDNAATSHQEIAAKIQLTHDMTCEIHRGKPVIMVCTTCDVGLCSVDMKILTKSKHKHHGLEDTETYIDSLEKKLDELAASAQQLPAKVDDYRKDYLHQVEDLRIKTDQLIKETARVAMQKVRKWQKAQEEANNLIHALNQGKIQDCLRWKTQTGTISKEINEMKKFPEETKLSCVPRVRELGGQLNQLHENCSEKNKAALYEPNIKPLTVNTE
jgi:hypothetical protein